MNQYSIILSEITHTSPSEIQNFIDTAIYDFQCHVNNEYCDGELIDIRYTDLYAEIICCGKYNEAIEQRIRYIKNLLKEEYDEGDIKDAAILLGIVDDNFSNILFDSYIEMCENS